jgi:hypothetical protein
LENQLVGQNHYLVKNKPQGDVSLNNTEQNEFENGLFHP